MASATIVPNLDVFKDQLSCLLAGFKPLSDTFRFECRKETFHHRVVITIAYAAHADLNVVLLEQAQKIVAGVLTALIAMMNKSAS